jgi:hypothetical protein
VTVTAKMREVAHRILAGDFSADTARRLEEAVLEANPDAGSSCDPCRDPWDGLISDLVMYEPFQGPPYVSHDALVKAILESPLLSDEGEDPGGRATR